jgi:nucleoside-diphosphate kinase
LKQRTLTILKPDCMKAGVAGKVLDRIINAGFKLIALKLQRMDAKTAGEFYKVHRERPFYNELVEFMSSGPCIPVVLEKENAIEDFRKLIGTTDPAQADPGTIRKDFAADKQNNIVHGSDSTENAKIEISFFFSETELI